MAEIKSMTLEQARAYRDTLKKQGKSESTSKEYAKVADYIKVLKQQSGEGNYGDKELASAYTNLSRGVTTTGGWTEANLDQIEKYTGSRPQLTAPNATPTSKEQLPSYLSGYQSSVYGSAGSPELRESISAQLEPEIAKPEPLNRVQEFEKMREEYGVADLESNLNDLKTQLRNEEAVRRQRKFDAEGKPVAMGVIAGRVSEIERQEAERIDTINREIAYVTDQLNTSYNTISTYINYMGLDYQDAVNAYQSDFNKNLQIYKLVDEEIDEQVATARANLQTFQNAILAGNINYNSLSSDQKAFITKLEVQSGLPVGFTASLKPEEKVLYSGTRTVDGVKYLDTITKGSNGQPKTNSISLGATSEGTGGGSGTSGEVKRADVATAIGVIKAIPSENPTDVGDKYLSPNEIGSIMQQLVEKFGDRKYAASVFEKATDEYGYYEWKGQ